MVKYMNPIQDNKDIDLVSAFQNINKKFFRIIAIIWLTKIKAGQHLSLMLILGERCHRIFLTLMETRCVLALHTEGQFGSVWFSSVGDIDWMLIGNHIHCLAVSGKKKTWLAFTSW